MNDEGLVTLLLLMVGCSYQPSIASGDAPSIGGDGAPRACRDAWLSGTAPSFDLPQQLVELASSGFDQDLWLTPDELAIVFASERASAGKGDVFRATRSAVDQAFASPVRISALSGSQVDEGKAAFASGFTVVVIASNAGGDQDLWYGTHASGTDITSPWDFGSSPRGGFVAAINTNDTELDPWLSGDGLQLAFSRAVPGQPTRIDASTRATINDPFLPPQVLISDPVAGNSDPFLAFDERLIVFASNRENTGGQDLWFATRANSTATFGSPQKIPALGIAGVSENDPWLSDDGCRVYFTSASTGNPDHIFVARMLL